MIGRSSAAKICYNSIEVARCENQLSSRRTACRGDASLYSLLTTLDVSYSRLEQSFRIKHVGLVGLDHIAGDRVFCRDLSCRWTTRGSTVRCWLLPCLCGPDSVDRSALLLPGLSQRKTEREDRR